MGDGQLIQSSLVQQLNSSQRIRPSMVEQVFTSLVESIVAQLLQSSSLEHCLHQCQSLMASDTHNIGLFSDAQLQELNKYGDNSLLLQNLKSLWSWSDHSILESLASQSDDAMKLLQQFDDHLNHFQLLSSYPIPCVSPYMAPIDDSPYTVLAIKSDQMVYHSTLQYMFDVRALIMNMCDITAHCLQLLAVRANPDVLYWSIPKCVVSLVTTKILKYHKAFHDEGISEVSVYPTTRISIAGGRLLGSLIYLSPTVSADDSTEVRSCYHIVGLFTAKTWFLFSCLVILSIRFVLLPWLI